MLYSRDFDVIKEMLARIQFEWDLSRFLASQQHLSAAMVSLKESQQKAAKLKEEMNETDFHELARRHRQAFAHTALFHVARPYLSSLNSLHRRRGLDVL